MVRRDNGQKTSLKKEGAASEVPALLEEIQSSLFARARKEQESHIKVAETWKEFVAALEGGNLIVSPFCGEPK